MQTFNFLESDLLDILFRGKNKQYGAYALRKFYPQRIAHALGITGVSIIFLLAIYYYSPPPTAGGINLPFLETETPPILIQDLVLPAYNDGQAGQIPPPPDDTYSPPTVVVDNITAVNMIPKPDVIIPPQDFITSSNPGAIPTPGMGGASHESTGLPKAGSQSGPALTTPPAALEPTILGIAEVMPEFPGGLDALMKYLKKHINYPRLATMRGVEGTVHVQFVVTTTGAISQVKILGGVGAGCDEEASRVIRNMPKWTPGIQNGHKVNVEYVIPVKFEL